MQLEEYESWQNRFIQWRKQFIQEDTKYIGEEHFASELKANEWENLQESLIVLVSVQHSLLMLCKIIIADRLLENIVKLPRSFRLASGGYCGSHRGSGCLCR